MDIFLENAISNFDIQKFLDEHDIGYTTSGKNIGNNWIAVDPCPACGDSRNHFAINRESKFGNCWVCGFSGNLVKIIANLLQINYEKAIKIILDEFDEEDMDVVDQVMSILKGGNGDGVKQKSESTSIKLPKSCRVTKELIKKNKNINQLFIERGLDRIDSYTYSLKLGMEGKHRGRLIIPVTHHKKLVAFQSRHLSYSNYLNEGPLKHYLYRYEKITSDRIIIVEGFFDYHKTYKFINKYFKTKYSVTTGFSKILTYEQIKLINSLNPKEVIFMLDGDSWFDYYKSSGAINCSYNPIILNKDKDPGSMSEKDFIQLFSENRL